MFYGQTSDAKPTYFGKNTKKTKLTADYQN